MTRLQSHLALLSLLLSVGLCEYDQNAIPEDVPPLEGTYLLAQPGDNCLNTCFDAGHASCMTNMEDNLYDAANALYQLFPEGDFSYLPSQYRWMEDYHPIVEADGTFIGWDEVPTNRGSCTSYPPDVTQRRLCRCGTFTCEDTFTFCRALKWVCHKYPYTQRSCPLTCQMCHHTARDQYFVP